MRIFLAVLMLFLFKMSLAQTVQVSDISKFVGQVVTVYGSIYDGKYLAKVGSKPTFLDFGGKFPNQFASIVIEDSNRVNFDYKPEEYLKNRTVWVTGKVSVLNDQYRISVASSWQIKIDTAVVMLTNLLQEANTKCVDTVFTKVDKPAEFPGGADAWNEYRKRRVETDIVANDELQPGSYPIKLYFIVRKDSTITDVSAYSTSGNCRPCLMDAMRTLKFSRRWIPALINKQPVSSFHSLTIYQKVVKKNANPKRLLDQIILSPANRPY